MTTKTNTMTKAESLAKYLNIEAYEVKEGYNDSNFEAAGCEYLVLSDSEADAMTHEQIRESVWAFNHSFLSSHSEAISEIPEKDFKEMQGKLCESFNKAVWAMIDDTKHFLNDAILSDGRAHFLNTYDGEEIEAGEFFIYRTN